MQEEVILVRMDALNGDLTLILVNAGHVLLDCGALVPISCQNVVFSGTDLNCCILRDRR